ncbi:hypothetical protein QFZ82_008000 [Streptomyces sp. V4I23]|nr:hypothetical protein [Streptomyces sp. V4I23]
MGWLPLLSRMAARTPRFANALTASRIAPLIKRLGGIAAERDVPQFAEQTFLPWFRTRTPDGDGHRGPVMLWVDSFNNHFTLEVLKAGVTVLEHAGFRVQVPDGTQCCGLTWITTGQLGIARRIAQRTVTALAPAARVGIPVVGLEPSCTAALKSDLPELLDGNSDAHALARATVTFAELLVQQVPDWQPPRLEARRTATSTPPPASAPTTRCCKPWVSTTTASSPAAAEWPATSVSSAATTTCPSPPVSKCLFHDGDGIGAQSVGDRLEDGGGFGAETRVSGVHGECGGNDAARVGDEVG